MDHHPMEIDLSGIRWKMQRIRPGQGIIEGFQAMASEYQGTFFNWTQAQVPGDVFVVNDLQTTFEDMVITWEIQTCGSAVAAGEQPLSVAADSSQSVLPIEWTVSGERLETFDVFVTLANANGDMRSENVHTLLIDDHTAAKAALQECHRANVEKRDIHGYSYYRYFPELQQFA